MSVVTPGPFVPPLAGRSRRLDVVLPALATHPVVRRGWLTRHDPSQYVLRVANRQLLVARSHRHYGPARQRLPWVVADLTAPASPVFATDPAWTRLTDALDAVVRHLLTGASLATLTSSADGGTDVPAPGTPAPRRRAA